MPTYEFRCPQGHEFEKLYRTISGAEAQAACPQCGQIAERMMSAPGFAFKGSGFYLTDYGKNAHRGSAEGKAASTEGGSGSSDAGSGEKGAAAPASSDSGTGSAAPAASGSSDAKKPTDAKTPAEPKPAPAAPKKSTE